jgi:hypothetical protein
VQRLKTPQVPIRFDRFQLEGGLDQHTPQEELPAGFCSDALNYEIGVTGGYARIGGIERYDGRPSPSAAQYVAIEMTDVSGLVPGMTVDNSSASVAIVAAVEGLVVVLTQMTGAFNQGEVVRHSGLPVGAVASAGVELDRTTEARYRFAAAEIYRASISAPAGSGAILGGFELGGVNFCFRQSGATVLLYRATSAGWTAVPFLSEIQFSGGGGGAAPPEGSIITQGAASARVRRVLTRSGAWSGTAAGTIVVDNMVGAFTPGAFTAGVTAANTDGAATAITLSAGGRFQIDKGDVGKGLRAYGCDGVNRGWEFDGSVFCPIRTGMQASVYGDAPRNVWLHNSHLFFSFGSEAQHSSLGDPYAWSVVTGAGAIRVNGTITAFLGLPGSSTAAALAIFHDAGFSILYGTNSSDWTKVDTETGVGCKPYAAQALAQGYLFDDAGMQALSAVQSFGNFKSATLTLNIRDWVAQRRTGVTASLVNRERSQYRLFFSDGSALFATIVNGQFKGAMPQQLPVAARCAWAGASTDGTEVSFIGGADGMVYRLDVGTSFDGAPLEAFCQLVFAHQGNAMLRKRYRGLSMEVKGESYAELRVGYSLAWGDPDKSQGDARTVAANLQSVYWDAFTWDAFTWDGRALAPSRIRLQGTAENIALRIESASELWPATTINSITLAYTPRRLLRGGN